MPYRTIAPKRAVRVQTIIIAAWGIITVLTFIDIVAAISVTFGDAEVGIRVSVLNVNRDAKQAL